MGQLIKTLQSAIDKEPYLVYYFYVSFIYGAEGSALFESMNLSEWRVRTLSRERKTAEVPLPGASYVMVTGPSDVIKLLEEQVLPHLEFSEHNTRYVDVTGEGPYKRKQYSRYDIVEHRPSKKLLCCNDEVIEIKDPPEDKVPILLHADYHYHEWSSLEEALKALEHVAGIAYNIDITKLSGYIRTLDVYPMQPWFYACGKQIILGDCAFPEDMQSDPVYTAGRPFVVYDDKDRPSIKLCVGCRYENYSAHHPHSGRHHVPKFRIVYFEDGTTWNESLRAERAPRPADESETWGVEAKAEFDRLLRGGILGFEIDLGGGMSFVGRLKGRNGHTLEGVYHAKVEFEDGTKEEGYFDFAPTPESPSAENYLEANLAYRRKVITQTKVELYKKRHLGKGWRGVFTLRHSAE